MAENPLAAIQKLDPGIQEYLKVGDQFAYSDGALPRRIKLLIAMAFDAAHGADQGVRALAGAAIRAGATKGEVVEALRVAYHLSGVGAVYTASKGLKELSEEG